MNSLFIATRLLVVAIFSLAVETSLARAQPQTDLCLKSGVTIHASHIEPRKGGYFVTPKGDGSPSFTIPADEVREIGAACQGAPAQHEAQTQSSQGATTPAAQQADPDSPRFGVHGSELLGARLMPLLVDAYAKKRGWSAVAKPTAPNSQEIELTAPGAAKPSAVIDLKMTDSTAGVAALMDGGAAIAMSTRRATPDEASRMKAKFGVDPLSPAAGAEHVVALDALAVIVHRDNPIKRLRFDQMAQIFSGQISNWKDVRGWDDDGEEVAGNDSPIHLHAPNAQSDSFRFFKTAVLEPSNAALASATQQHDTSKKLSKAVSQDIGAIGLVEFPYISKNDSLVIATTCGLFSEPSRYSAKTEQYPLTQRLYLYSLGEPRQQVVRDFLQFTFSDEAQESVSDAGFIDQSVEFQDLADQRTWVKVLAATPWNGLTNGGKLPIKKIQEEFMGRAEVLRRTSVVFRFESDSYQLDSRALEDIKRLARYLQFKNSWEDQERFFALSGFADSNGGLEHNISLSKLRAEKIMALLRENGVKTSKNIAGYSSFAPVACNDTDEGRSRNRRVETWRDDMAGR